MGDRARAGQNWRQPGDKVGRARLEVGPGNEGRARVEGAWTQVGGAMVEAGPGHRWVGQGWRRGLEVGGRGKGGGGAWN